MNPEKVEIAWYVTATVADAGHVSVVGDTKRTRMYWDDAGRHGGGWERDYAYATRFDSRLEAETYALKMVRIYPQYMGKLRISRKRLVWHPAPPPPNA